MTSHLPLFWCLFLSHQLQINTKNRALVMSLRSFSFRDDDFSKLRFLATPRAGHENWDFLGDCNKIIYIYLQYLHFLFIQLSIYIYLQYLHFYLFNYLFTFIYNIYIFMYLHCIILFLITITIYSINIILQNV